MAPPFIFYDTLLWEKDRVRRDRELSVKAVSMDIEHRE
jgi:hypothetical protein